MAGKVRFQLDTIGVQQVLQSPPVRAMVNRVARQIADDLEHSSGQETDIREYTTDRASASVAIAHPAGVRMQIKHGYLSRAAGRLGLVVRSK